MDLFTGIILSTFGAGYLLITLEHKAYTHKSAVALSLGAILWIIVAVTKEKTFVTHSLHDSGAEIFQIVAFLLAAMALVEILVHYRFFDIVQTKLAKMKLKDRKQFIIIGFFTFFLSAILDNLTVTIVMTQIAKQFFKDKNLLISVAGIIILANAGGAWSPIGDVTTIMLWLANKYSAIEIITHTFIPSALLAIVSGALITRQIKNSKTVAVLNSNTTLSRGEKVVITMSFISFTFPVILNIVGLPPYLGLLLGLGIVWGLIEFAKHRSKTPTHLNANIEKLIQRTDISSIKFFIGILLAVSAMQAAGVLETISVFIFGEHQEVGRVILGSTVMGLLSAVIDNVPLTALSIDLITIQDSTLWSFVALTVGTGGSALVIGSVAGIVAMGMVKNLTFGAYLRIATLPSLVGYFVAVATFTLMFFI